MQYKLLGRSGLRVSELCLGTMTFGEERGTMGNSKEECRKIFDAFVGAGGNFIDTANKYMQGTSERWVGEFLESDRDRLVVATKYSLTMDPDDPNAHGNHRKNLVRSVEESLKRLNTDYIDVLWVHAWDFMTPVDEVMRSLDDLVQAGKVLYLGISNTPAWIVAQAITLAELRGWTPFIGLQLNYNLTERSIEREFLPMADSMDLAVTAYFVLAAGVLTGKYNRATEGSTRLGPGSPVGVFEVEKEKLDLAAEVIKVAEEIHRTPSQVALNWVRQRQGRAVMIPILGARTEAQIRDNLGCLDFKLEASHLDQLNEVSKIPLGYPHELLQSDMYQKLVYGNTFHSIQNHRE
jgi:aryl-alcohol dehydrogenase-like predicted oxidoreductase